MDQEYNMTYSTSINTVICPAKTVPPTLYVTCGGKVSDQSPHNRRLIIQYSTFFNYMLSAYSILTVIQMGFYGNTVQVYYQ
jgi:hypothetical protein